MLGTNSDQNLGPKIIVKSWVYDTATCMSDVIEVLCFCNI